MADKREGKWRISALHGSKDFLNWRLLAKVSIAASDHTLLGLSYRPDNATATVLWNWEEANANANRTVVCALGYEPLLSFNALIEDGTASSL